MRKFAIACLFTGLLPLSALAADGGCIPADSVVLVTPGGKAKAAPSEPAATAATSPRLSTSYAARTSPVAGTKAGPTARILPGAMLRGSPTVSTQDQQPVPNGSIAMLKAPFKNNDGAWWYVTVNGVGAGWFRLADLTDFSAAPRE